MATILALFRGYNDVDHMIPVLWKAGKKHTVCALNIDIQSDYSQDPRVQYACEHGLRYINLIDLLHKKEGRVALQKKLGQNLEKTHNRILRSLIYRSFTYLNNKLYSKIFDFSVSDIMHGFELEAAPDFLVVDHGHNPLANHFIKLFRSMESKIVSVPHAIINWSNVHTEVENLDPFEKAEPVATEFQADVYVSPNQDHHLNLIDSLGVPIDRSFIAGSARFCSEWRDELKQVYAKELEQLAKQYPGDKINVVWFLTKEKHNIFQEEVFRLIQYVSNLDGIRLLIKPHTRGQVDHLKFELPDSVIIMDSEFSSFSLQKHADSVIFSATSVIVDALIDRVPTFYLRRTVANRLIYESYFEDWSVDCREDLRDALIELVKNKKNFNIETLKVDQFLQEMVWPETSDVLVRYCELFNVSK